MLQINISFYLLKSRDESAKFAALQLVPFAGLALKIVCGQFSSHCPISGSSVCENNRPHPKYTGQLIIVLRRECLVREIEKPV